MNKHRFLTLLIILTGSMVTLPGYSQDEQQPGIRFFDRLDKYVSEMLDNPDSISEPRKQTLDMVADYIRTRQDAGDPCCLTFICTHNSRRSHMAQVWAEVAAKFYGLDNVKAYSGGTQVTALNQRVANALRRAGFSVVASTTGDNPVYLIQYSDAISPIRCFSKSFSSATNPQDRFAAILCCGDADEKCPNIQQADARFSVHYTDPKASDDTTFESATYDGRCRQIATEMFYLMSQVN